MSAFAVFGNPVKHSKSPKIYSLFADEIKINGDYSLKLVSQQNFDTVLLDFFSSGGLGANITVPFKERALFLCNHLTKRALIAKSVNTIKKQHDNTLLGDNTDGIGLINDLKRLKWINQDNTLSLNGVDYNRNYNFKMQNILVIGSGGSAKGIISSLLNVKRCHVNVINRTFSNAKQLVRYYYSIGLQNISCINFKKISYSYNKKKYNLIINATSSSMYNDILPISPSLIQYNTKCYDVFYKKEDTVFIEWCKKNGSNYCSDGLGMLVGQAAYAFKLWHDVFPNTTSVFNYLQSVFRV